MPTPGASPATPGFFGGAASRWLRARLSETHVQAGFVLLGAALAAAAIATSILIFDRQAALGKMSRYNLGWPASQAGMEVARLQGALGELAITPGEAEQQTVRTWFGIVESRLSMLLNGEVAALVRTRPELEPVVSRLSAAVEASRPLMRTLGDEAAVAAIMAEFTSLNRPLARLASVARAHALELDAQDVRHLDRLQWLFSGLLVALIGCSLALAAFAVRRNRLLARSNAEVRALVLDLTRTGERLAAANERVQEVVSALTEQNATLKERDAEMLRQNRLFEAALNNMSHGLGMFDEEHRLIVGNRRFSELFALPPGLAVPGAEAKALLASSASFGRRATEATWAEHRRLTEAAEAAAFVRADGAGRSLSVSHQPLADGGWVATYEDVTARLLHQTKLEEQAALLDLVQDGIVVRGMDGRIVYANRSAVRMHGWTPAEVAGMDSGELVERIYEDPASYHEAFRTVLETGQWSGRFKQRHRSGHRVVVESNWSFVRNEPRAPDAILVVHTDITERLALEERLRQSQRLEAVGQLTGGVAHDFNNLLTVILGSSETLVESLGGDEELRGLAEMTMTAAERGAALTSQLLAFSRRQTLEPRVVEVGAVLGGLASMLGRTLGAHIALHLSSAPELWPALIDQSQLENAVLNLCINARDAMPAGGSLVIASSNLEVAGGGPADGELSPGRYVVIEVVDSGTGMAPEVLGRAFEPFFTTKEVGQGSGLGLSMVYGFMKQSGGHVELASTPGRGTTVRMVLKAAAGAAAPAPARPAREAGGAERVLLVEDDAMVRTHVAAMLRGLGYTVTLANNAAEGLARLEAGEPFELLLSDVVMPGAMNGLQLAVRARQMRPAIGLLLTSGYTENAIQQHGSLEPGMLLLSKPYRRHELATKVRTALEAGRLLPKAG